MRRALTAKMGAIWVQPSGANNPTYYLDCKDLGDLTETEGAETLLQCFDASGVGWEVVGSTVAPPDPIAFDITGLMFESLDWLEEVECPFTIYVLQRLCGRADNWSNYVRGFVIQQVSRQQKTYSGLVARDTDAASTLAASLQAYPPLIKVQQMEELKKTVPAGQTLAYNAIAMNTDLRCLGGGCGDEMDPGERGMAVGQAAAGQGQVVETSDDGDTWTAGAAATVLGAAQHVTAVVRFPYGRTGARYICMGNPGGGGQGIAAYSDDRGTTWSATVNVGGAATDEAAEYGNALFALNERQIWCVGSTLGEVNFSEDGGETWTTQEDGVLLASIGYCIHFERTGQYGFAGGQADAMMRTMDGGSSWVAANATGGGGEILCCQVLDEDRVWVGTDDGTLWYSRDFGVTWTQRTGWPGSGTGEVKSLAFWGDHIGYMAYNDGSNVGHVNYTFDGGYTWERLTGATLTAQLNHIVAIDESHAWAVGEPDAGPLGVIVEVLPA
jgi:photosystem II stability/assembly factor-like uncharacterized protein